MSSNTEIIVVHRDRDGRWIISREYNGWDPKRKQPSGYRSRKRYITGGDHATWRCALSWAESWVRQRARWGYRPLKIVVDKKT
jgi:hypothetical protein